MSPALNLDSLSHFINQQDQRKDSWLFVELTMDDSSPPMGSPGLASTLPSLADLHDLDSSPFVDGDSSDEDATDYSDVLSLTSHSGNQANQSNQEDEEWVVRVEDRTITISRLVTSSVTTMTMMEQDDYDQDSVASSSDSVSDSNSASSASPSTSSTRTMEDASLSNSDNQSVTTDPGAVVALLNNTASASASATTTTAVATMPTLSQRLGPQTIVSDSSCRGSDDSDDSDDTRSDTDSQDGRAKTKKSRRFWIVDSLHQKRRENQAKAAAEQMQQQERPTRILDSEPEESSSSPSVLSFVDPTSFMERMPQLEQMQEEHGSNSDFDDDDTSSGHDTSTSEIHLLDINDEDEENSVEEGDEVIMDESDSTVEEYIEEIIDEDDYEEEEVFETEESLSTVEEEVAEEEEVEEIVIEEAPIGQKQCMIFCTRKSEDEITNARQKQTIEMIQNNGIPFDILYGDDAENQELKQLLFQLAGTHDVYPQLFITTPDGETAYWGDWHDLVDNSVSDDGGLSQSSESLPTVANDLVCEFVWERVGPPTNDAGSSSTENNEIQQQKPYDEMADEREHTKEQVAERDALADCAMEANRAVDYVDTPSNEEREQSSSAEQPEHSDIADVASEDAEPTREEFGHTDTAIMGVRETEIAKVSLEGKLDTDSSGPEITEQLEKETDEMGSQESVVSEDCLDGDEENRGTLFDLPAQINHETIEEEDRIASSGPKEIAHDDIKEEVGQVASISTEPLAQEEAEKEDTVEPPEPVAMVNTKKDEEGSSLVSQKEIVQEEVNEEGSGESFEPQEQTTEGVTEEAGSKKPVADEIAKQEDSATPFESPEKISDVDVKEEDSAVSLKSVEQVAQEEVHPEDTEQLVAEEVRCSPTEPPVQNAQKEGDIKDRVEPHEPQQRKAQENVCVALNLRPNSEEAVSDKLSEAKIMPSTPQNEHQFHSANESTSLFNNTNSATNKSPFQPSPYVERVEQSSCNKITSSTRVEPSDALMEKIKPSSKTCAADAVMEKTKSTKATLQGIAAKSKKKDKAQEPKKEAKSKVHSKKKGQQRNTTKETKVQVENPVMNCYSWYNRMGRPSRSNMKRRVSELPKSCGVEIEHIDLLPWDATGATLQIRAMREILLGKPPSQQ